MPFDFPSAPAVDDVYTSGGVNYTWNGTVWSFSPDASSVPHVKIPGDTMTGELILPTPNPSTPTTAAHKRYVDETVATQALWQGVWLVESNTPNLDPAVALPLNGYGWTAVTADPNVPEIAPAGLPGIGGKPIGINDGIRWNANTLQYDHIPTPLNASAMIVQDNPPVGAFPGQVWWDSNNGKQYVWFDDGTSQQWVQISGGGGGSAVSSIVPVSDTPPASASQGMLWFDSANGALFVYFDDGSSAQWLEVGPP